MDPHTAGWYYASNGEQQGPIPFPQLKSLVSSGQLDPVELIWAEGMADWRPYRDVVAELSAPAGPTLAPGMQLQAQSPLPIPPDLQRVSFMKLMVVGGIAIVLLIAMGAGVALAFTGGASDLAIPLMLVLGLGAIGVAIYGLVLSLIYLYRGWKMLQGFRASTTPGIAVGLLFVPLFNLYWNFRAYHAWARDYNDAVSREPRLQMAPRAGEGVFLTFCLTQVLSLPFNVIGSLAEAEWSTAVDGLLSLVGLICLVLMYYQLCTAVNFFIDVRDREVMERARGI